MFKKEIKKITKGIIVGSIILIGTAGVYASNSSIQTYISNFSASDSEIGKLITNFFDDEGYLEPEFLKKFANITQNTVPKGSGATLIDSSIYVDDSGNVGIGTTTPSSELEVHGTLHLNKNGLGNNYIKMNNNESPAGKRNWMIFDNSDTGTLAFKPREDDWGYKNAGLSIAHNGNVGIGTTTPDYALDLRGNIAIQNDNADNYIKFHDAGNVHYSIGTDRSDGGKFKINYGGNVGYRDHFTMTTNGNVGIGTTTPTEKLDVNGNIRLRSKDINFGDGNQKISGDNDSAFYMNSNNSSYTQLFFRDKEGTTYGRIYGTTNGNNFGLLDGNSKRSYRAAKNYRTYFYIGGQVQAYIDSNGDVYATSFKNTSDIRLKKDIKTLDNSLEKINKLRGVHFKWKKNSKNEIGLIAQEVEEIYPDLVSTNEEDGMKSVKYGNIVAILIEGVKELYNKVVDNSEEIEKLKVENTELKNKLNLLEEKIDRLIK